LAAPAGYSRMDQRSPLGSAPAPSFLTTARSVLPLALPGILSALAAPREVVPRFRALLRALPLALPRRISAPSSGSSLLKVWRPHKGFPIRVVVLAVSGVPCRPILSQDLAVVHFADVRWLRTQAGMFTRSLAPCPFRDSVPSEVSPSDQLPPSRASSSPAVSHGCEALLRSKVPGITYSRP
jgi:hypothetical protein